MRVQSRRRISSRHHQKVHLKSIIYELLCGFCGAIPTPAGFRNEVSGYGTNGRIPDGDLGHIYGYQWRSWPDYDGGSIDQITRAVEDIRNNPDSRRIIVSSWNVADLDRMNLPPCHAFFQFYVAEENCRASSISAAATAFLACRSISRAMRFLRR